MQYIRILILLLIQLTWYHIALAQDEGNEIKYTNRTKEEKEGLSEDASDEMSGSKHVIKTNLFSNVYGSAIITYDYAVSENFSFAFSAGATYDYYIVSNFFFNTFSTPQSNSGKIYPIERIVDSESYKYKTGMLLRIAAKIFTDADFYQEGPYWAFEVGRNAFQSSFEYGRNENNDFVIRRTEYVKTTMSEFRIYYGKQKTFGSSRIFYDYHVAAGVAFLNNKLNYFDASDTSLSKPKVEENIKSFSPRFSVGFSLGYGF